MGLLCKLFKFLLNVFTRIVEVVASAIKVVGTAVVDVLSDLVESASNALFGSGSWLTLAFVGVGLYLLLGRDSREGELSSVGQISGGTNGS